MDTEAQNRPKDLVLPSSTPELTEPISYVGPAKYYLCGYFAAFNNIAITFPIQKVLFRQQLYGLTTANAIRQLKQDGFRNLYRGILPPLLQKTTTVALMFGLYEDFSCLLKKTNNAPELFNQSVSAVLAGTAEAVLTPFERVQALLQDRRHHNRFKNTFHAFKVLRAYGIKEYYRGLVPILLRNGPSNALFFALRGPIKQSLPEATTYSMNVLNDFICGGFLGSLLGIIFYPINVVKARMQSQVGGEFQSFAKVFMKIWTERDGKVSHLMRGVHLNYHRSILSWGIINATYEILLKVL
ncbi:mitochondrial nicotinamide adenine dinucleotide transporter SLC25A51-like [Hemiscyllium ocellatum]|uniref:mitochondrial nicotinamide adenine dinucleotide transporter SLC25A51-like n=1 Tax=Hemiscyllium ocellatum TaxID=170820 RepID=UPI002966BD76|nr:mitochondrial nicotinamide adenine dinucleotide transporter SLC25A51-like [Hemiscyllium ocellatum]XP_060696615.1 mitochondrial nicotinamide adenine dinucleotide transporter SLC25A51-like [Hemiscyllium ocellatum]